jgi:hypothetical protein
MPITRPVVGIQIEKLGTEVYVSRLSAFMVAAIMKRAEGLYPLPDPKPFEQPLPDAVVEGDVIPAIQNPVYQKLMAQVMLQRNRYLQYAALNAIEIPDCTHEEIVALYAGVLKSMRQYADIPDGDDFAIMMHYCILTPAEYREIVDAATKEQSLSQEEVMDGMAIFRSNLSQHATNGNHPEEVTPDISKKKRVSA